MNNKEELTNFTTKEILIELLKREKNDNSFELKDETITSYTFKFFK